MVDQSGRSFDGVDAMWEAFVQLVLPMGALQERPSQYGDKPAVFRGSREIAHYEAPGQIDLRITRRAWIEVRAQFGKDGSVNARPGRRDWVELTLETTGDVVRLSPLIAAAVAANR